MSTPTPATAATTPGTWWTGCRWTGWPTCTWPAARTTTASTTTPTPTPYRRRFSTCSPRSASATLPPAVMLERDGDYPAAATLTRGARRDRGRGGSAPDHRITRMTSDDLARRQAALVAALVAGGPDSARASTRPEYGRPRRAGPQACRPRWPRPGRCCGRQLGPQWGAEFATWAAGRPPRGSLRDGWDFARHLAAHVGLEPAARQELAERESRWRYDGVSPPRRRRLPHARRTRFRDL